ncbi:unnamed protein product [Brassica rapa]|uniref:Uncharacterized protein n=1 Tax=Brassica campestris TaxID=3711 RepID=A0A8D9DES7_BRACM|nr:unnamed protein product [Brassica rapa]
MCADGHKRTATDVLCVLTDTHGCPVCADGHPQTSYTDTHGHTRTATDVLCVLADTHGHPVCIEQTAHVGQNHPNSPREGSAVSVLSPRTNVLICVQMDCHGRPVCADGHTRIATDVLCVLTDTHRRPVCADGHTRTSCVHRRSVCADGQPQTSCVCWQTPTDVLCVLNRQPTLAKITQTVHGKGLRAESKDQRADMCTDGQPRTAFVRPVCADGHTQTATDVLCVLAFTHGHPVSTNVMCVMTDSHGRPVCAGGHPRTSCVHEHPVCAGGHPQTSFVPRGPKPPKQSTGRVSMLSPRTNVLICVLMDSHGRPMDSHGRPVCADGHTRTATDVLCVLTDTHGRPVCADGHTRTQPTWAKITRTVHGKGQCAESKDQRADMSTDVLCVLTDTHGHTWTATDARCVVTDTHERPPRTSSVCWRTPTDVLSTNVLCVLADTHGRPVCTEQTAHVGQNHPNSPRERPAC